METGDTPDASIGQERVAQLPWGHHVLLLTKLKTPAERLRYAEMALAAGWRGATAQDDDRPRMWRV